MKAGSIRYKALLDEAFELHLKKNQGYAANNPDAFANFRLAEGIGLTPLQGVLVRLGDKFARVQSIARDKRNDLVNESLRDTLMDLSAYALIGICLMEETGEDARDEVERKKPRAADVWYCCPPICILCANESHSNDCKTGCSGCSNYYGQ